MPCHLPRGLLTHQPNPFGPLPEYTCSICFNQGRIIPLASVGKRHCRELCYGCLPKNGARLEGFEVHGCRWLEHLARVCSERLQQTC